MVIERAASAWSVQDLTRKRICFTRQSSGILRTAMAIEIAHRSIGITTDGTDYETCSYGFLNSWVNAELSQPLLLRQGHTAMLVHLWSGKQSAANFPRLRQFGKAGQRHMCLSEYKWHQTSFLGFRSLPQNKNKKTANNS